MALAVIAISNALTSIYSVSFTNSKNTSTYTLPSFQNFILIFDRIRKNGRLAFAKMQTQVLP
jgi:hypothetical protein